MYPNPYGNQPGGQSGFQPPPYPTQNQGPGYPPPPAYPAAPYPPQAQPGFGGYPGQVPSAGGYPPANPGIYPNHPGNAPYPNQPGGAPYPNQPGGAPYPSQPGIGFPNQTSTPGYPNQPSGGYPGQALPPSYPPQSGYPTTQYQPQGLENPSYPPAYGTGLPAGYSPTHRAPEYPIAPPTTGYSTAAAPGYATANLSGGSYQQSNYPPTGVHSNLSGSFGSTSTPYSSSPSHSYAHHQQPAKMEVPTIKNVPNDATADAGVLRKAMKGFGTDEAAIISILAKRTNIQRLQIAQAYKTSYGKDLIKDLKSELGGRLEQVVLALMTPLYDYMAETAHKAMSGAGTKEGVLVDILCTATNEEIRMINASYTKLYRTTLERDLHGDTSGSFARLLVSMTTGGRNENPVADSAMAAADAQTLYEAGEKKWGTDESAFNAILATRSYPQLRGMLEAYENARKHSFEKAIENEFSGDIKTGMLAVVKAARNRAAYFAERIHDSVAGMGTKDDQLIFLIVTRSEIDLETVKQEYQRLYNKSLVSDVGGDTGGDYKKILLALAGN